MRSLETPARASAPTTDRLDEGIWRSVLAGGTEVLSECIDSVQSVAVGFWFRRGTAHEDPSERGIAHLLEHLVFKGTERRSARQLAEEIESVGGSLDAYTTHEHTSFQARVPATHLQDGIDVLSDLSFSPALRERDLDVEREVVLEELARVEDTPEDLVFELHAEFLYGDHPYGAPILGTRESLERIDVDAVRRLRSQAYCPSNLVVAAAGCLEHEVLLDLLEEWLPEAGPAAIAGLSEPGAMQTGSRRVHRPGGRQVHIVAGCPGFEYANPLRYAAILVGTSLGGGMSSRLFQRIREELGLAYSVFSFQSFYGTGGHAGAYLGTRLETADAAREALLEELLRVAQTGLTTDEEKALKEQLKGQLMLALETPASRMHRLAALAMYGDRYRSLEETAAVIDEVTSEDLRAVARLYHPERLAVLELWPS
jgi:predicted Zn-dependent peptidase